MSSISTTQAPARSDLANWIFVAAVFLSATLVFTVQPMIAKLLLPRLGGSPAVWNASMVFFQAALLVGYGYAHVLQGVRNLRVQGFIHLGVLAVAALLLPLHISGVMGPPSPQAPVGWLLATLALSVGGPFAALSATAPLIQSWFARVHADDPSRNPYALYVASNLGSMLALLSYPVIFEPLMSVREQQVVWSQGYLAFALIIAALALTRLRGQAGAQAQAKPVRTATTWRARAGWVALSATPSSLLLGVTAFISTDIAAAPLMWVVPLALFLLTFIICFQDRPTISREAALLAQAVLAPLCLASIVLSARAPWWVLLPLHLATFFAVAMVCHRRLADSRPEPDRLTEFYFCVSLGGVLGGAATALLAPVVFDRIWEYSLVLVAAGLARPSASGRPDRTQAAAFVVAGLCGFLALSGSAPPVVTLVAMAVCIGAACLIRARPLMFVGITALLGLLPLTLQDGTTLHTARTFFGVHRVLMRDVPALGGPTHVLAHGSTMHGAQPLAPGFQCRTTNYYSPQGAIGQTYAGMAAQRSAMSVGVVGLGSGSVVAYLRPQDRMRFFEIDPEVEHIARDRRYFTYMSDCAKGPVDVVIGDARLTMAKEPAASYDLIHLDAFSSDAIPTHLITTAALHQYLDLLKPDGVLLLHISNRHLALEGPAAAAAEELGAHALIQTYRPPAGTPPLVANASQVMLVSRSEAALARFAADGRWRPAQSDGARAWTDDYMNLVAALVARIKSPPF